MCRAFVWTSGSRRRRRRLPKALGRFVTHRFASCAARAELAEILNLPVEALAEDDACAGALTAWLLGKET